jgi:UDP-N-acetylglucosamine acyltransferase
MAAKTAIAKVHPTAIVDPGAQLGAGVEIGPFCIVGPEVRLGAGTRLHSSVVIEHTEMGEGNEVYPGAVIGVAPQDLRYNGERSKVVIGHRNVIREYVTIHRASTEGDVTSLGNENLVMAYAHVAHNCILGNQIVVSNSVGLCGHVEVEDQAVLGGMCGIHQFVRIGRLAMVGGMAKVTQDVPPFGMVDGQPARLFGMNIRGMQRRGISKESRLGLKHCFRLILRSGLNLGQALEAVRRTVDPTDEINHLLRFFESPSRMGFCVRGSDARRSNGARQAVEEVELAGC